MLAPAALAMQVQEVPNTLVLGAEHMLVPAGQDIPVQEALITQVLAVACTLDQVARHTMVPEVGHILGLVAVVTPAPVDRVMQVLAVVHIRVLAVAVAARENVVNSFRAITFNA